MNTISGDNRHSGATDCSLTFFQEHQNLPFTPDPLMQFGLQYHRECEAYDQTVCSMKNSRGFGVPEGKEHSLVNRNAKLVRRRLADELIEAGLATPENAIARMQDAISMAGEPFRREWDRERR